MANPHWTRRTLIGAIGLAASTAMLPLGAMAQDKPTYKIGFIGPLSGGNAPQGLGARNGFLLALEQFNAGDHAFQVSPEVHDDAADPQTGVGAAMKLVNDPEVIGAIGHWNSSVALATIPVFSRFEMPFIVWGAISPKITEQNLPQVTRVTPTLVNENLPLAAWTVEKLGAKTIAVIADTSDYGTANAEYFSEYVVKDGAAVVSTDLFPVGATDFRSVLTRIKSSPPDAIYFGGVITEAAILRRQMVELGLDVPMIGISGFYDPEFIAIAGEAAEGTMVSYPTSASNPKLDQLDADYAAHNFAEPSSPYTKYAFDAANILLTSIETAGLDDKAAIAETIRGINYDGVLGVTTFDANGQTEIPVGIEIKIVKNGEWVTRED